MQSASHGTLLTRLLYTSKRTRVQEMTFVSDAQFAERMTSPHSLRHGLCLLPLHPRIDRIRWWRSVGAHGRIMSRNGFQIGTLRKTMELLGHILGRTDLIVSLANLERRISSRGSAFIARFGKVDLMRISTLFQHIDGSHQVYVVLYTNIHPKSHSEVSHTCYACAQSVAAKSFHN